MTGSLPLTIMGRPSYSLAKARIKSGVDDLLWKFQDEYGLTDLEMCDVLADITHSFLRGAVCHQQERSRSRSGAAGTPREDG